MKKFLALIFLTACVSSTATGPCGCVIIPPDNGQVSFTLAGRAVDIDADMRSSPQGESLLPVRGDIWGFISSPPEPVITMTGSFFGITADINSATRPDLTRRMSLSDLRYHTSLETGIDYFAGDGVALALGPRGGTLQLREIEQQGANDYRLRGGFSAQVCEEESGGNCRTIAANFAFSVSELPDGAVVGNLLRQAGGS